MAEPCLASHAILSDDGRYRYQLNRAWSTDHPAVFIMLNPSTADGTQDDPTIRRCVGFAKALGCGGLVVVNLYALRATDPRELWKVDAAQRVGPTNDAYLSNWAMTASAVGLPIVAAWGANAKSDRVAEVLAMPHMSRLAALGVTKSGAPRHPLYLPSNSPLTPWPVGGEDRG